MIMFTGHVQWTYHRVEELHQTQWTSYRLSDCQYRKASDKINTHARTHARHYYVREADIDHASCPLLTSDQVVELLLLLLLLLPLLVLLCSPVIYSWMPHCGLDEIAVSCRTIVRVLDVALSNNVTTVGQHG